jgi:YlmC/YmxH family sporulation protein
MRCCVTELRSKDVICRADGRRIGTVCDVEFDTCSGQITAFILFGRGRCFGLFGHEEDIRIRWEDVEVIGDDAMIVTHRPPPREVRRGHFTG